MRASHPEVIIGAVTNARADPARMPRLAPLFDFCVSGEDAAVWPGNKPSPTIYEHALEVAASAAGGGASADTLRSAWVHVGDCLLNDVEASKRVGAQTLWLDAPADELSSFSTASAEEEARRVAARQAALEAGYVDERIERFEQLPSAVARVLRMEVKCAP